MSLERFCDYYLAFFSFSDFPLRYNKCILTPENIFTLVSWIASIAKRKKDVFFYYFIEMSISSVLYLNSWIPYAIDRKNVSMEYRFPVTFLSNKSMHLLGVREWVKLG